jgi:hypothetical protein
MAKMTEEQSKQVSMAIALAVKAAWDTYKENSNVPARVWEELENNYNQRTSRR